MDVPKFLFCAFVACQIAVILTMTTSLSVLTIAGISTLAVLATTLFVKYQLGK